VQWRVPGNPANSSSSGTNHKQTNSNNKVRKQAIKNINEARTQTRKASEQESKTTSSTHFHDYDSRLLCSSCAHHAFQKIAHAWLAFHHFLRGFANQQITARGMMFVCVVLLCLLCFAWFRFVLLKQLYININIYIYICI
jgi:hypothetical protein